jgi:c-di-GMP-related signal transduction protein
VPDRSVRPDVAFTLGLLDGIAETLGMTPAIMLEGLPPLSGELHAPLLGTPGSLRSILDAVLAYERRDLESPPTLGTTSLPTAAIAAAYLSAIAWTSRITGAARTES